MTDDRLNEFVRRGQAAQAAVDDILRTSDRVFVIWSIEHDAWWRPGRCGYTRNLRDAGRYDFKEADEILGRANFVKVNECAIPVNCLESGRSDSRPIPGRDEIA